MGRAQQKISQLRSLEVFFRMLNQEAVKESKPEPETNQSEEFKKFDMAIKQLLSVSHEEVKRRNAEWKKARGEKGRAKT
jgi:hypothetical protein